jgi:hypothetical protein
VPGLAKAWHFRMDAYRRLGIANATAAMSDPNAQ